jgi:hypothetical protein
MDSDGWSRGPSFCTEACRGTVRVLIGLRPLQVHGLEGPTCGDSEVLLLRYPTTQESDSS